jgi:hypothetical protein
MTKSVDEIIREAMERGKFNDLPNKGKKLDLDDYFNTPEDLRLGYSILKSADFVPEEVQLLQEIEALREKLAALKAEDERKQVLKEIEFRRLKYNLLVDRFKHK